MKHLIIALAILFSFNSVSYANNEFQLKTASEYFTYIAVTSTLIEQQKEKFIHVLEDYIETKDFEKAPPRIHKETMKAVIKNLKRDLFNNKSLFCILLGLKSEIAFAVCNVFKVFFCLAGVLDALHVNVPLTYYVYINVTVIANSAPKGLLNTYRKNTGHDGGLFISVQNAASLHNFVVVERNSFIFDVDDFPQHNEQGDDEKTKQNVPPFNNAPRTLFHYVIGLRGISVNIRVSVSVCIIVRICISVSVRVGSRGGPYSVVADVGGNTGSCICVGSGICISHE